MINDLWNFFTTGLNGDGDSTVALPDGQTMLYSKWLNITAQIENPKDLSYTNNSGGLYRSYPTQVEEVIYEIVEIGIRDGVYTADTTCHHTLASRPPADPFQDLTEAFE